MNTISELPTLVLGSGFPARQSAAASEQKRQIGTLLDLLCQSLELPEGKRQIVEERYQSLGDWLDAEDSPLRAYRPRIHSHGSMRLGTTVRPPTGSNHDLDSVCRFAFAPFQDPALVKKLLLDRLYAHGTYGAMTREKPRCARVEYQDFFHHDIMPCVPDLVAGGTCVLVPDKTLRTWKESDPEGFAKRFDEAAAKLPKSPALVTFNAKIESRANVEPLPEHDGLAKEPLRRCVQIIKRHRDEHFLDAPELAPISVVLTTLAMHAYEAAVESRYFDTPLDLIIAVVAGMPAHVESFPLADGQTHYAVANPTNPKENFAEKWNVNPLLPEAFYDWHRSALTALERLARAGEDGMDKVARLLGESLGHDAAKAAVRSLSANVRQAAATRQAGVLSTGVVTLASPGAPSVIPIRRHTNFGAW